MSGSRDAFKDLFLGALERPPSERDAFLAEANANPELLQEVRTLLASHRDAGSFLGAGPPRLEQAPTLVPGQRLGPYEVVELIGQGGMGEVYRARDTRLGRQVAVKVLPHAFERDTTRQKRFEDEARAASALNHPNVLSVYDVGTLSAADGSAFLVMELLEGGTLRSRLQQEPSLTRERVIDYAVQVARGLTAAHAAGIVHRDLKPENLFVTADGRMKILDFGVAKMTSPEAFTGIATQPGVVIGTAGYMAPEQVRGQPADARSDIFAFGTVLFEMITGERAFAGDSSIDTLSAILHSDPLQTQRAAKTADAPLFDIVRRCIAKQPDDRYQTAAEVATALEAAARPEHRHSWPRTTVAAVIAAAVVAIAITAGIVWPRRAAPAGVAAAAEIGQSRVIAVLPLENISADQSQLYLTNGVTEEITAQLARLSSLRVMSRAAVAQYRDVPDPPRRLRAELGVGALLTGSVRLAGDRARISVQLVDTGTAQSIWTQQYDQSTTDILKVQSDVARHIASALQATLSAAERQRLERLSTNNAAAYELYLKAMSAGANPKSVEMLQEAVRLDPKFALAYAGLSRQQGELGALGDRQYFADALASARSAVEADPNEARAHHALATIQLRTGHLSKARQGYLRALELAPSFPNAAWDLSITDAVLGRLDESLFWARRGFTFAPNVSTAHYHVAVPLVMLADVGAAERWLRGGEERFPRAARIQYMLADVEFMSGNEGAGDARVRKALAANPTDPELQAMVAAYAFLRNAPDADARIGELFKQSPESRFLLPETARALRAHQLMKRGDTAQAAALLDQALASAHNEIAGGSEEPLARVEIAAIHALRGERAEALRWMSAAYQAGDRLFREYKRDPFFSTLQNDSEFLRILKRMEDDVAAMRGRVDVNDNPLLPPLPPRPPAPAK